MTLECFTCFVTGIGKKKIKSPKNIFYIYSNKFKKKKNIAFTHRVHSKQKRIVKMK